MQLYPTAVLAGRLPGTPDGLGEIQYTVFDDPEKGRSVMVAEVVEYEHDRRALSRSLIGQGVTSTVETIVEDLPGGDVVLTHHFAVELPAGAHRHFVREYQALLDEGARRLASRLPDLLRA